MNGPLYMRMAFEVPGLEEIGESSRLFSFNHSLDKELERELKLRARRERLVPSESASLERTNVPPTTGSLEEIVPTFAAANNTSLTFMAIMGEYRKNKVKTNKKPGCILWQTAPL